ncbi:MAG: hypothetical protein LBH09_05135, partial [Peptococcaceae bacterium]|nr:hypothetical protein [Peptococcaceae bacterium]
QLFYEGTDMTTRYDLSQAVWMLQASLLLEPESYETNYNLALTFNQLGTKLMREEKHREAGDCYKQAQQYFDNAEQLQAGLDEQLKRGLYKGGEPGPDERHDPSIYREW